MDISSRKFTLSPPSPDTDALERTTNIRRVTVSAEVLKQAKLTAGDLCAIRGVTPDPLDEISRTAFAIGVLWPSLELSEDGIEIHQHLLTSAHILSNKFIQVFPLPSKYKAAPNAPLHGLGPKGFPPYTQDIRASSSVRLQELPHPDAHKTNGLNIKSAARAAAAASASGGQGTRDWLSLLIRETLVDIRHITHSLTIDVTYESRPRRFVLSKIGVLAPERIGFDKDKDKDILLAQDMSSLSIKDTTKGIDSIISTTGIWTVSWTTQVVLTTLTDRSQSRLIATANSPDEHSSNSSAVDPYSNIGGLASQLQSIRDLIELPLRHPALFRAYGLPPPRGVLLHGPPGTGKTHLARAVASGCGVSVLVVNGPELSGAYHGETEGRLRGVFEEARRKSPCIVVIDELDALCPARADSSSGQGGGGGEVEQRVVATLLTLLDGFGSGSKNDVGEEERIVVVATTNRPNAIDPALRRPGRLDREIEIGVPDASARADILCVLLKNTPHALSTDDYNGIAARMHGYVGADIAAVVREAGTRVIKRLALSSVSNNGLMTGPSTTINTSGAFNNTTDSVLVLPKLTAEDLLSALPSIRPSALRPLVASGASGPSASSPKFSDIGGQAKAIQTLRECVEWPLKHAASFARLGVQPPRGVLLYGPPGCSKTSLVRALVGESGVNYVGVKGPELLSKYVGDSERAVRNLFSKARALAPCILFFDEIDALGSARGYGGGDGNGGASEGILTSMLTEMDGVQQLGVGVTIVGATNRPEVLDMALMRPGRLDRLVYVGLPDEQGRREVLKIRMKGMSIAPEVDIDELVGMTEGCSGAEIGALCTEAAMLTMQQNIDAPHVDRDAFVQAAKQMRRAVTPGLVGRYEDWRDGVAI